MKTPKVIFAKKTLEDDYNRLAASKHMEDKRLYLVLKQMRSALRRRYSSGKKVPSNKIPAVYKRMFHIDNLLTLNLSHDGPVLYSIVGNEIRIIDLP